MSHPSSGASTLRKTWRILAAALVVLAFVTVPAGADGEVVETSTEFSPGFFDRAAYAAEQDLTQRWLTSEEVGAGLASPITLTLSAEELALADRALVVDGRLQVGLSREMALGFDFSSLRPADLGAGAHPFARGAVRAEGEDGFVWSAAVSSPGATAIRLHFSSFSLPAGAELYVYNRGGEAFGPYSGRGPLGNGELWTNTLTGSEALIQLRQSAHGGAVKQEPATFTLAGVSHLGAGYVAGVLGAPADATKSFCSFNEPCVENASCSSIPGAIQATDNAMAHLQYVSGPFVYICSGGLVADTDTSTTIPYLITANHCISSNGEASSLEAFFQFTTPCNGSCYNPVGSVPRTSGSVIRATGSTSDYTLLELSQAPPAGSAYLGWTTAAVANSNGTDLFRLSHPGGAPQAYSEHSVDTSKPTCGSWPRGNWIYSQDTFGATEGGSSGSPVLNSSGQLVGQLSGACGFNVNDPCDAASNATVDGAFAAYFPNVAPFLDPAPCTDADGDGWCSTNDCDDNDPNANPGLSEICGDGVDNNCNGTVDEGCGTCLPKGASCTSDNECCSNKCKGKPGRKSCK